MGTRKWVLYNGMAPWLFSWMNGGSWEPHIDGHLHISTKAALLEKMLDLDGLRGTLVGMASVKGLIYQGLQLRLQKGITITKNPKKLG